MTGRFSPRLVLGVAIIVLVLVIVVAGRLIDHSTSGGSPHSGAPITGGGDLTGGDGLASDPPPAPSASASPLLHRPEAPSQPPGAATPVAVARSFATAWLHHDGVTSKAWVNGLAPYATSDLIAQLNGVDPASVPASRLTKGITIDNDTATDCLAEAPTEAGVLSLSLELITGQWRVTGIDWTAS